MSGDGLLSTGYVLSPGDRGIFAACQEASCGGSVFSVSPFFCVPGPRLLCKHPLCVGASVVMAACCVLGTGLLCEHLLCDYFLSASLCGILLLRWGVGCWAHRVDEAFSCGPICFPPPSDHP